MANIILFLFVIIFIQNVNGFTEIDINVIENYLETENGKSVIVNAFTCSAKGDKLIFLDKLFKKNYISSVMDINENFVHNFYPYYKMIFILNLDCDNVHNILNKANNQYLLSSPNSWLLISHNNKIQSIIKTNFTNYDIFPDSNILLAQKVPNNTYIFKEIYKISNKNNDNIIIQGNTTWTPQGHDLNQLKNRIIANERQNLHRTTLGASIVILDNDTLKHLDDYRNKHIDSITKVNYVLTKHLVEYVNGTLVIYPVNSWGYKDKKTNKYNGMIGSMEKNESEIGGTALFVTQDRIPIIDYIAMTSPTKVRFVFRQPPLSYEQNIFTLPFSRALWISAFILVALTILLQYSAVFWEWKHPKLPPDIYALQPSLPDVIMFTLGAVAQQGAPTEPRSGAGKIIMLVTFIALMFLYVSYSANIVALLQSSATNIRTLEDLLESRLKLGADDTVYNRYYMSTASDRIRKGIYDRKIAPPGQKEHFIPLEDGVKKIQNGFYAFHMELGRGYKIVADTFLESEKCGLQEINFLSVVDPYFSVKKNSSYKEIFKLGLRKIQESGLQSREQSKIYTNKPECHSAGGNFISVGLIDSYPAFLFLGTGVGLAILLFILEILVKKNENKFQKCIPRRNHRNI